MRMEVRISKKLVCELDIVIDNKLVQEAIEYLRRKLAESPDSLPDVADVLYTLHHDFHIVYPISVRRDAKFKLLEKLLGVDPVSVVEYALHLYLSHLREKQRNASIC